MVAVHVVAGAHDLQIFDVDRRVSRAISPPKGVKLNAGDLDLLIAIELVERLASAKAKVLTETASAECRRWHLPARVVLARLRSRGWRRAGLALLPHPLVRPRPQAKAPQEHGH